MDQKNILKDDVIIQMGKDDKTQDELIKELPESKDILSVKDIVYKDIFPTKEEIGKDIEEKLQYPEGHPLYKHPNIRLEIGQKIKNPIKELKNKLKNVLLDVTD